MSRTGAAEAPSGSWPRTASAGPAATVRATLSMPARALAIPSAQRWTSTSSSNSQTSRICSSDSRPRAMRSASSRAWSGLMRISTSSASSRSRSRARAIESADHTRLGCSRKTHRFGSRRPATSGHMHGPRATVSAFRADHRSRSPGSRRSEPMQPAVAVAPTATSRTIRYRTAVLLAVYAPGKPGGYLCSRSTRRHSVVPAILRSRLGLAPRGAGHFSSAAAASSCFLAAARSRRSFAIGPGACDLPSNSIASTWSQPVTT